MRERLAVAHIDEPPSRMLARGNFMAIKTIPLSRLEANPRATLSECPDSGLAVT
jgi:hypothetical protein